MSLTLQDVCDIAINELQGMGLDGWYEDDDFTDSAVVRILALNGNVAGSCEIIMRDIFGADTPSIVDYVRGRLNAAAAAAMKEPAARGNADAPYQGDLKKAKKDGKEKYDKAKIHKPKPK